MRQPFYVQQLATDASVLSTACLLHHINLANTQVKLMTAQTEAEALSAIDCFNSNNRLYATGVTISVSAAAAVDA
eukprot:19468-Heterococcus_DN1.PRE.2